MGLFDKIRNKKTYIGVRDDDILTLNDNTIHVTADSKEYDFELKEVERIVLFTTDMGPFEDDMGLEIELRDNKVIMILSGHKCFKSFLFDQIGKVLPIDYKKIIDAASCTDNRTFELFKKRIELSKVKDGIKISGSINLGYIGTFKDSQIEILDTFEEIRKWDIVSENLDKKCTDEEIVAFLNDYYNDYVVKIEKNIDNINGTFLLNVITDMDNMCIDFMAIESLFIEDKLFYGNEEDVSEIYNTVREGLNSLTPYLDLPNDGSIMKGHVEATLRSFYPMLNFDNLIANVIPEYITLNNDEISFQCSDNFDNEILCGAYGVFDEKLCINDWHNF